MAKSVTEGLENYGFGMIFLAGMKYISVSPAVVATQPYIHIILLLLRG
jgi:hypothetical protein